MDLLASVISWTLSSECVWKSRVRFRYPKSRWLIGGIPAANFAGTDLRIFRAIWASHQTHSWIRCKLQSIKFHRRERSPALLSSPLLVLPRQRYVLSLWRVRSQYLLFIHSMRFVGPIKVKQVGRVIWRKIHIVTNCMWWNLGKFARKLLCDVLLISLLSNFKTFLLWYVSQVTHLYITTNDGFRSAIVSIFIQWIDQRDRMLALGAGIMARDWAAVESDRSYPLRVGAHGSSLEPQKTNRWFLPMWKHNVSSWER